MKNLIFILILVPFFGNAQLSSVLNKFPEAKCVQCDYAEVDPIFNWPSPRANPSTQPRYHMLTGIDDNNPYGDPESLPHAFSRVTVGQYNCPTPLFGNTAYRVRLNNTGNSNTRAELHWGFGGGEFTDARWFMGAYYIPTSFCTDHRVFGLGFDSKHANSVGPAAANIKVYNGRWTLDVDFPQGTGEDHYDIAPLEKGKWTYLIMERNFEDDASGFIRIYMWTEGTTPVFTQKVEVLGANYHEYPSSMGSWYYGEETEGYYVWGPYIWGASGNEGSGPCDSGGFTMAPSYELYMDNLIVAKSTATIADFNNFISGATTPGNQFPIVSAGANQTIILPDSDAALDGTVSDPDGTIEGILWTQVSGPNTATMSNAGLIDQTVSNLIEGTYIFNVAATDDDGATSNDEIIITVQSSTPPPTVAPIFTDVACTEAVGADQCTSVGTPDQSIQLPISGDTVIARAVHQNGGGYIVSFAMTFLSGPGPTPTINQFDQSGWVHTQTNFGITGMTTAGTYAFKIVVTDNDGTTANDTMNIVVVAESNDPPTVNAGTDQTLTLDGFGPFLVKSTTLNGLVTDDGSVASVVWSLASGPENPTFGSPTNDTTLFSGLVSGTYSARLTATDNAGLTASDIVSVRILTCNAGLDQVVASPGTTATLTGGTNSVSDTTDVLWEKISGTGGTITSSGTLTTGITGLSVGAYEFQLTVTHTGGYVVRDRMRITVTNASSPQYYIQKGSNPARQ